MSTDTPQTPAIACTLGPGDFKERLAWIGEVNRSALRGHRRDGLRLELIYAPDAVAQVRDMVSRERNCCAFLSFDLHEDATAVRLVIEAPEAARGAADALLEPFLSLTATAESQRPGCGDRT